MENIEFDLFSIIAKFYRFVVKYFYIIGGALLVGIVLAIISFMSIKPFYKNTLTVTVASKEVFIGLLEKIDRKAATKNYAALAKDFNAKISDIENLSSIEVERRLVEDAKEKKKVEMYQFDIIIFLTDSVLYNKTSDWLTNLAQTNPYLKEVYELELKQKTELIKKMETELKLLDSLQKSQTALKTGQIVMEDNASAQEQKIKLYKSKLEVEAELQLWRPLIVVDNNIERKLLKEIKVFVIYPLLFVFLALMFGGTRELLLNIWKLKKQNPDQN